MPPNTNPPSQTLAPAPKTPNPQPSTLKLRPYIPSTSPPSETLACASAHRLSHTRVDAGRENYHFILVYPMDASIYPANLVRNLALEPVRTNFVFLLDIDLIPDVGFYPYVMSQLPSLAALADSHMFTIPAFQGLGSVATVEAEFPVDKDDLIKMVDDKRVKPILSGENEFWQAFSCLNYDKWCVRARVRVRDCACAFAGRTLAAPPDPTSRSLPARPTKARAHAQVHSLGDVPRGIPLAVRALPPRHDEKHSPVRRALRALWQRQGAARAQHLLPGTRVQACRRTRTRPCLPCRASLTWCQQYRFGVLPGHFLLHWTHALAEWAGALSECRCRTRP